MTAERIRILRVTEQSILGGEQAHILYLLADLDPARYEQTMCSAPGGPFVEEVQRLGVAHIPVAMRGRTDLGAIRRLRSIIGEGGYDLVHLHGARAGLLGRIAARLAGAPLIVWTMHVFQPDVLQGWRRWQVPLYLLAEGLLARGFCDQIITISEDLRRRALSWERVPAGKVTTIYSYADLAAFAGPSDRAATRRQLGVPPEVPLVCTVGRLCVQKGVDDFLRAAARVRAQMPQVRFLVVGDGPLRGELASLAGQLGLDGCLTFTGHRSDVPQILLASDLFATATHWEGFGKVNVEAMAAGKPLVSTDVGPIPEVAGGYRGAILVPPRAPEAFAQALLTILRDLPAYTRRAEAGREQALARFGREALAQRTGELYERLIARALARTRQVGLRMRIGISTFALSGRLGMAGSGRYVLGLVGALAALDHGHELVLLGNRDNLGLLPASGCERVDCGRVTTVRSLRLLWEQLVLPIAVRWRRVDILHSPVFVAPLAVPCASVVSILDMTWFSRPEQHTRVKGAYFRRMIPPSVQRAQRVIAISEATMRDVVAGLGTRPDKVAVTYLGTDQAVFHPGAAGGRAEALRIRYGVQRPYVLYLGKLEPRKNLPALVRAFDAVAEQFPDHQLVLGGNPGWDVEAIYGAAVEARCAGRIRFPGFVEEADLPALYAGADLFVYPSSYEGFGFPVLEAMASGTPVITSDVSSLPEVAGDAGLLVDPADVDALAAAIHSILSDGELRRKMRIQGLQQARQFTWEETARQTLEIYREAHAELCAG